MALYVYGIMRARDAQRAVAGSQKGEGPHLEVVEHRDVSALVTRLADGELKLRRDNVLAHADVLQAASAVGPVLPVRLGTALRDDEAVAEDLLAPRAAALLTRLDELEGKAEMQVKGTYAEEPLLRSILDQDPALRNAVQRTRGLPAAATHFDQIRIGEAISGSVEARRVVDGEAMLGSLRPLAIAVSVAGPHHERAVLNAAFLVERERLSDFDAAVEALSREWSPEVEFKLIGPLPPYSFVERPLASTTAGG